MDKVNHERARVLKALTSLMVELAFGDQAMTRIGKAERQRTARARLFLLLWAGLLAGCGPSPSPQATAPTATLAPTTTTARPSATGTSPSSTPPPTVTWTPAPRETDTVPPPATTSAPEATATTLPAATAPATIPLPSDTPPAPSAQCKLFILAGQSNMVGRGRYDDLPAGERALPDNVSFHQVALNSNLQPVQGQLGPEYGLTHALAPAHPGGILVVKYAVDASSLLDWAPRWDRAQAEITGNPHFGPLYHTLLGYVAEVQASREVHCPPAAVVWMQGERDARFPEAGREYEQNLEVLIRSLRRDLDAPDLPFLLGRINPPPALYPAVEEVQRAQAAVAQRLDGVVLVSTEGLAKQRDELHYNTVGQIELGRRFAEVFLQLGKMP